MSDVVLDFEGIRQSFPSPGGGTISVLEDISLAVHKGRFTAVIGPSGCGKSTLLQMAAGLLAPTAGTVHHNGTRVSGINRHVGFVPQQAQLFPWKTLFQNVELPLVLRGVAAAERRTRVTAALSEVGLEGFDDYFPHQLSGGMQKRGSIARTLVYRPDVILMDEPFGALDAQTKMVMQSDLQVLAQREQASILFVTHDINEAIVLADEVVVLSQRPTRVLARVAITCPRPRNIFQPFKNEGFEEIYGRVWSIFRSELHIGEAAHA
jgi:NitT/TauT family transport system ATP-binding protein